MNVRYLWQHRSRPPLGSRLWFKTWAKRAVNAPSLLRILVRVANLRRQGARIGELTVMNARILGRKSNLVCGRGCAIGDAKFALHAPLVIGDNVAINDRVTVLTASHDLSDPAWKTYAKAIHIEDHAWIAEGATLLPGIKIGRGAVVGAQAVVTRDVAPFAIVVGNPARPTRKQRTQHLRYQPSAFFACFEAWLGPQPPTTVDLTEEVRAVSSRHSGVL